MKRAARWKLFFVAKKSLFLLMGEDKMIKGIKGGSLDLVVPHPSYQVYRIARQL